MSNGLYSGSSGLWTGAAGLYSGTAGLQAGGGAPTEVPANSVAPVITGTAQDGETLTASTGTWSNSPSSYAYQWYDDAVAIGGATASTLLLTATQVGGVITVGVVATNIIGSSAEAVSAGTAAVIVAAPVNSVAPAISGTETEDETLSVTTGTWSGSPTYAYVWKRSGSPIGGATASTYTLVTADVGETITCTVTATNAGGSTDATSAATGTIAAAASTFAALNSSGTSFDLPFDVLNSSGTSFTIAASALNSSGSSFAL